MSEYCSIGPDGKRVKLTLGEVSLSLCVQEHGAAGNQFMAHAVPLCLC